MAKPATILISPPPKPSGKNDVNPNKKEPRRTNPPTIPREKKTEKGNKTVEKRSPAKIKKLLNECGNNRHLRSLTVIKTRKLDKTKLATSHSVFSGNRREQSKNRREVAASTAGYCREIGLRQNRHLPFKRKKLTRGILSRFKMAFLQWGQEEAGEIRDPPLFQRIRQTFRKLPTQ